MKATQGPKASNTGMGSEEFSRGISRGSAAHPDIRSKLIKNIDGLTRIKRQGCGANAFLHKLLRPSERVVIQEVSDVMHI